MTVLKLNWVDRMFHNKPVNIWVFAVISVKWLDKAKKNILLVWRNPPDPKICPNPELFFSQIFKFNSIEFISQKICLNFFTHVIYVCTIIKYWKGAQLCGIKVVLLFVAFIWLSSTQIKALLQHKCSTLHTHTNEKN